MRGAKRILFDAAADPGAGDRMVDGAADDPEHGEIGKRRETGPPDPVLERRLGDDRDPSTE